MSKEVTKINNKEFTDIELILDYYQKKISFATAQIIHIVPISQIIRCEASTSYTNIYIQGNKKITVSKGLKAVEEQLSSDMFIRVHKSHLVNLNYIKEYKRKNHGILVLNDDTEIFISARKKDFLLEILNQF